MVIIIAFNSSEIKNRSIFNFIIELILLNYSKDETKYILNKVLLEQCDSEYYIIEDHIVKLFSVSIGIKNDDDRFDHCNSEIVDIYKILEMVELYYKDLQLLLYSLRKSIVLHDVLNLIDTRTMGTDTIITINNKGYNIK